MKEKAILNSADRNTTRCSNILCTRHEGESKFEQRWTIADQYLHTRESFSKRALGEGEGEEQKIWNQMTSLMTWEVVKVGLSDLSASPKFWTLFICQVMYCHFLNLHRRLGRHFWHTTKNWPRNNNFYGSLVKTWKSTPGRTQIVILT